MNTLKYKDLLVPDQGKSNSNTSKSTSYNPIAMSYASPLSSGNITPNVSLASAEGLNSETVKPLSYEEWYNRSKSNAEESYQNSVDLARINFEKMKSEYGSRAAALESMGMTGSGYSDYLTSKAYTEMQGAIVNAAAQKDKTIADLDTQLTAYLEEQDAKKKQEAKDYADRQREAYTSLYNNVLSGVYSYNDIDTLAPKYGLSPDDRDALKSAIANRILESGDYTKESLAKMFGTNSKEYKQGIANIVKEAKNYTSADFFKEGKLIPKGDAQKIINQVQALDASTAASLQNEFNKLYTVKTAGVTFKRDTFGGGDAGDSGNNFVVTDGDKKYKVEFSGKDVSEYALAAGSDVDEGTVFKYSGNLYVKHNGTIYHLVARKNNKDDWNALFKLFN